MVVYSCEVQRDEMGVDFMGYRGPKTREKFLFKILCTDDGNSAKIQGQANKF